MAEEILMPRLSDTMTEGVIAAWHKKVGDTVKKGDLLAEVETDKATMELESYKDGVLLHIGTGNGGKLQVNDLMAIIGNAGEDISGLLKGKKKEAVKSKEPGVEKSREPEAGSGDPKKGTSTKPAASIDISTIQEVILMPRLSDTMTEGVIAAWHKNVGDQVKKGDLLADIETDKATMELESYKDGKLLYAGAKKGDKVPVNSLLCIIGEEGKVDVNAIVAAAKSGTGSGMSKESGGGSTLSQELKVNSLQSTANSTSVNTGTNGRVKASPLAKKLAAEKGIELTTIHGTGDGGRIIKSDIDNYKSSASVTSGGGGGEAPRGIVMSSLGKESFEEVPVSQMRKVIARRLAESKFSAPHFYLTMAINMDKAVESRTKINEVSPVKISFNDMVLKACALALKQHPKVNSSWLGDKIRYNHHVSIGVAVAVEEGLLVPVIRFADTKSFSQIAEEVKTLAKKAKDKKLQPAEWEGNTFTISNLGMFGIEEFTAIINPPDACILAVGAINQIPIVKEGQIVIGNIMKVTLSCDHRVVDGASGSAFLQTLQGLLEEPLRMLV